MTPSLFPIPEGGQSEGATELRFYAAMFLQGHFAWNGLRAVGPPTDETIKHAIENAKSFLNACKKMES
jgi:hypothetical protein